MEEQCESAADVLLNDLRQRTEEYYLCTSEFDVQQLFVLRVSSVTCPTLRVMI